MQSGWCIVVQPQYIFEKIFARNLVILFLFVYLLSLDRSGKKGVWTPDMENYSIVLRPSGQPHTYTISTSEVYM